MATNADTVEAVANPTPLLTALRNTRLVTDGIRDHLPATTHCILNADDEGYGGELAEAALKELQRPQAFFVALRDSAAAPSCNDERRGWVKELLLRAQEAGLYSP